MIDEAEEIVMKICNNQDYEAILKQIIKSSNENSVKKFLNEIYDDRKIPKKQKQKIYEIVFDYINYTNNELIKNIKQIFRKGVEEGLKINIGRKIWNMKNEIVDVLYQARLEKMSTLDKADFGMLQSNIVQKSENEAELEECLIKVEDKNLRNMIKDLIDEKFEIEEEIFSYIKENFYKFDFADAKNLLMKND